MGNRARKNVDPGATFQTVTAVAKIMGFSRQYLMKNIKTGEIPHIRVGNQYYIHMPLYEEQLRKEILSRQEAAVHGA